MKNSASILVVDDEPGMRVTLDGILRRKGYAVTQAADGAQAIEAAQHHAFDVILMDVKMPGMTGVEAFLKIKQMQVPPPVIIMTGFAIEEDLKEAEREGVYAILPKPIDMAKMLALIEKSLAGPTPPAA